MESRSKGDACALETGSAEIQSSGRLEANGRTSRAGAIPFPQQPLRLDKKLFAILTGARGKPDAGDFVLLETTTTSTVPMLDFHVAGRSYLGPTWEPGGRAAPSHSKAKLCARISELGVELAEWTFTCGDERIRRIAFLLRGRRLALVADEVRTPNPTACMSIALRERIVTTSAKAQRGLILRGPKVTAPVRIWPIGLPTLDYPTERGGFSSAPESIVLRQSAVGGRVWLPLLLSWHPQRDRRPVHWRTLTVSRDRKACRPHVAFAARVGWKGEPFSLVFYRSLARSAPCTFLGYQTSARFLVGLFSPEGVLTPIVHLD